MNDVPSPPDEFASPGREPKVIKRYTNRKLYDTVESRYVTLDEIAEMIKAGAEVKVVDNRTKDDLTAVTLAQIIFEEEKKTSKMSLKTLLGLIRHGSEVAQQLVDGAGGDLRGKVDAVRQAAESRVQGLLARGQQTGERARELVSASQEALASLQKRIDERVRAAAEGVQHLPEVNRQLEDISQRIAALESKLDELTRK
ncbi:MAG: transcriptional regulator [Anaeromyxobacter sp.]|nr:transcriptional regulator [Anaeromyxobacter sp.]MBL0277395.1 transcriptional regulator [Anaeromyxobacter sp.]